MPLTSGPTGPEGADNDSVFRSLTVHPRDPNIVLMGTERNGFVRSTDGGQTWTRERQGLAYQYGIAYPEIWDIAFSLSDPNIVFAATLDSPGPVTGDFPSAPAGVYKSVDGGQTWARRSCGLPSSRVTSIAVDPANPEIAIAGLEGGVPSFTNSPGEVLPYYEGGIYITTNGGESWTKVPVGQHDGRNGYWIMKVLDTGPATLLTFGLNYSDLSENLGFLKSADSGQTWQSLPGADLTPVEIVNFDVSKDLEIIYAVQRDVFFVWMSADGGETWAQSSLNQATGPIAISPADPKLVVYGSNNSLMKSTDGLKTYARILTTSAPPGHFRDPPFHDIVFAPSDPSIVYAATEGYLLYKSTDAGATWALMANIRAQVLNTIP